VGARNERMHQVYDAMPDDVEAAIIDQLDPAPHALMSWKHLQGVLQELGVEEYVGDGAHQVPVPACSRASAEDKAQVQADSKRFLAFVLDLEGCLHIDRALEGATGERIEQRLQEYCDGLREYVQALMHSNTSQSKPAPVVGKPTGKLLLEKYGLKQMFRRYDFDGDGTFSKVELGQCLGTLGVHLTRNHFEQLVMAFAYDAKGAKGYLAKEIKTLQEKKHKCDQEERKRPMTEEARNTLMTTEERERLGHLLEGEKMQRRVRKLDAEAKAGGGRRKRTHCYGKLQPMRRSS